MAFIDRLWSQWSPGFDGTEDARRVKESLTDPAHLSAALGYYRATLGQGYRDPALAEAQSAMQTETPTQPVLYLHGETDGCIGVELARAADAAVGVEPLLRYGVTEIAVVGGIEPERRHAY